MFQGNAFQSNAFQMTAAIIAFVMVFRSLYTTVSLAADLTTTITLSSEDFTNG
jgi:hypothetical protein